MEKSMDFCVHVEDDKSVYKGKYGFFWQVFNGMKSGRGISEEIGLKRRFFNEFTVKSRQNSEDEKTVRANINEQFLHEYDIFLN